MPGPRKPGRQPARPCGYKLPESAWEKFWELFSRTGNLSRSADGACISRVEVYRRRKSEPEFEAKFQETLKFAIDAMEEEAQRRAFEGFEDPVFYKGDQVGTITRYSDPLAMFLLKAHRPEKYKERVANDNFNFNVNDPARLAQLSDEELDERLAEKLKQVLS